MVARRAEESSTRLPTTEWYGLLQVVEPPSAQRHRSLPFAAARSNLRKSHSAGTAPKSLQLERSGASLEQGRSLDT